MVLKYVILALMGIIGMIVVAVDFLKLAGAMNTMAKVQQSHQITMDLGKVTLLGGEGIGLTALPGPAGVAPVAGGEAPPPDEKVRLEFNVRLGQVPFLLHLIIGENPANVTLVAQHLKPEVRSEFLKNSPNLSPPKSSAMAKVRFIESEVINTLKDELEILLSGAAGGIEEVLLAIEGLGLRGKRGILVELEQKHADLAAEVRKRIFSRRTWRFFPKTTFPYW